MRFLTLDDCVDRELHCIYHNPEKTVTLLHLRSTYPLQVYAPEEDYHIAIGTYQSRKRDDTNSWWLQLLGIVGSQLLGIADSVVRKAIEGTDSSHAEPAPAAPQANHELIRYHLTNLRSAIPNIEALNEEEHIQVVQPPPSPWSFPAGSYYREARPGRLNFLSEPLIAELVNVGLLIASDTGIRWRHMDQHILILTEGTDSHRGRKPRLARSDIAAFRRARVRRLGMNGEFNGIEVERSGTPIVELDDPSLAAGEKRVRLFPKRTCVLTDGEETIVKVEDLKDNEGKSAEVRRAREAERVKKHKARSKICWDSDRWS